MEDYGYQVPPYALPQFPGAGDGYSEFYGMNMGPGVPMHQPEDESHQRKPSPSRTKSCNVSPSASPSQSQPQSRSVSVISYARTVRKPSFLDSFRILYLNSSSNSKEKYLTTKKRQDHVRTILKNDGLGSKKWLFYPRSGTKLSRPASEPRTDQRIKIEADFFRKFKSKEIASDSPILKLKRWELILYKKLGFLQSV